MGRKALEYNRVVTPELLEQIPKWKRAGRNDEWVAAILGISPPTMRKWKKEHREFSLAFQKGRAELLDELVGSAVELAKGKMVIEKDYSIDAKTGEVLDDVINIRERYKQSPEMLKHLIQVLGSAEYGKPAMNPAEEVESDDRVIFYGEDDL